jgi:predicted small lipoprotein YifL
LGEFSGFVKSTDIEETMGDYTFRVGERQGCARVQRENGRLLQAAKPFGLALLLTTLAACGDGEKPYFPTNEKAAGALVSVEKGDTVVGFARGKTRVTEKTDSFKISKHPVTKKQYKDCQKAGVCKEPKLEECSDPELAKASMKGDDANVAVCVGKGNAETFCKWVGGRLPTLTEWLRAARGPSVQEYPWGDSYAKCSQHPKSVEGSARGRRTIENARSLEGCSNEPAEALVTNKHGNGAAKSSGMQDVLLAPAELVVGSANVVFGACSKGHACLVDGLNPASIDSVKPYSIGKTHTENGDGTESHLTPTVYGFRCLVEN